MLPTKALIKTVCILSQPRPHQNFSAKEGIQISFRCMITTIKQIEREAITPHRIRKELFVETSDENCSGIAPALIKQANAGQTMQQQWDDSEVCQHWIGAGARRHTVHIQPCHLNAAFFCRACSRCLLPSMDVFSSSSGAWLFFL